jgi:hypothetical protein|tara:strand:- start:529 stop:720 length:192 start_codon:yes stop_codon:yes gene_type:complete
MLDITMNIENIQKRLVEMDQERIRLQGMLEVFQTIGNLGVNKIEKPAEEELNIVNTEEVIDGE